MKISGNKKKGHYTPDSRRNQPPPPDRYHRVQDAEQTAARGAVKRKNSYRAAKILIAILVIILAILVAIYIFLNLGLKPPPVKTVPKPVTSGGSDAAAAAPTGATEQPVRDKTKFTFVILGMDDGNGNTDTMMVATFDDANYTLNVVNIPRDTLVNVSWHTKKANTFYANGGVDSVITGLSYLLGYEVDYYVKIDLDAFSKLVDGVGGVDFDVPKDMDYDDDAQDLHIHLNAGPQQLDGAHALQLVRARKDVWSTGDIGRINTQQAFLKAAAGQILEKKGSLKISALIDIFLNDVDTDLTVSNLGWFAQEFLKMSAANIGFETIPAKYDDSIHGVSYCTIQLDDWLNVINHKLNPFDFEIKAGDLSILTRNKDGDLYVTNGAWAGKKITG